MEKIEFEFRKVSLENLGKYAEMFRLCLGKEVNEDYFNWKYRNNPAGEVVAFEAVHNGNIAGFYGVIPETYQVDGKDLKVYQSMDTMTHPDYQKRGLFTTLAKKTYDFLAHDIGDVFIVGIPGGNSFPGFVNKLNWKNTHSFSYIFLHRMQHALLSVFDSSKKWRFEYITEVDKELISLLHYFNDTDKGILPKITADVFNWKVFSHPFKKFKVCKIFHLDVAVGYSILSLDEKGYIKIELLKIKHFNGNQDLVSNLSGFIFKTNQDASFIYTWKPYNKELGKLYKRGHFIHNPYNKGPFSYRVPFIVYAGPDNSQRDFWFEINRFDIQPLMQD